MHVWAHSRRCALFRCRCISGPAAQSAFAHVLLQVSSMTKDTQDTMARAQAQSDTADAHAAELQRVRLPTSLGSCRIQLYRL